MGRTAPAATGKTSYQERPLLPFFNPNRSGRFLDSPQHLTSFPPCSPGSGRLSKQKPAEPQASLCVPSLPLGITQQHKVTGTPLMGQVSRPKSQTRTPHSKCTDYGLTGWSGVFNFFFFFFKLPIIKTWLPRGRKTQIRVSDSRT